MPNRKSKENVQNYYKLKLPVSISNEEQSTILQEIKYHIFPVSLQLPEKVSDKETDKSTRPKRQHLRNKFCREDFTTPSHKGTCWLNFDNKKERTTGSK